MMKKTLPLLLAAAMAATTAPVMAQNAPPAAAPAASAYSTSATPLGELLDNPATKAVLEKHIPQLINNEGIAQARAATLKDLQGFTGGYLTDELLAAIDADLAKVPAK